MKYKHLTTFELVSEVLPLPPEIVDMIVNYCYEYNRDKSFLLKTNYNLWKYYDKYHKNTMLINTNNIWQRKAFILSYYHYKKDIPIFVYKFIINDIKKFYKLRNGYIIMFMNNV